MNFSDFWQNLSRYSPLQQIPINEDINVAAAAMSGQNNPAYPASTFIRKISFEPHSKIAFVRLGNNMYWYPMNEKQLATWLRSKSLGAYYNQHIKLK